MAREIQVEQYLVARVKELGGWAIKGENCAGFPDRIVIAKGFVAFVEVKAPDGRVSKIQDAMHRRLASFGFPVEVLWSREGVDDFLRDFFFGAHELPTT